MRIIKCNGKSINQDNVKVIGNGNRVRGKNVHVIGDGNDVVGPGARVRGNGNRVDTTNGDVRGINNQVTGRGNVEIDPSRAPTKECVEVPDASLPSTPALEGAEQCIICMTNTPTCAIVPCGHAHLCVNCSRTLVFGEAHATNPQRPKKIPECPECRVKVKAIVFLFQA